MAKLNRDKYRCVIPGKDFGGRWEFLYKGKWHEVKNYTIKKALNDANS